MARKGSAEYNAAFDAGVARRMGEDQPKGARKASRSGAKTAHVPAGHANGGQFTSPRANPPRAPRPGADTKKRRAAVVREQMSVGVSEAKARRYAASVVPASQKTPKPRASRAELHYGPRPSTPAGAREYHEEVEHDLARALQIADNAEQDGSWTHEEAQKARGIAKRMATNEHKKVPGWNAPAKPAPKPRAPRKRQTQSEKLRDAEARLSRAEAVVQAEASAGRWRIGDSYVYDRPEAKEVILARKAVERARNSPKRRKSGSTVPRQGRRTRRDTQQRAEVYSEARRGLHNRRARGA